MFLAVDSPRNRDLIGTARETIIMWHDVDQDSMPAPHACCPAILHDPIGAAVEIGVLCEMIEGVAGAVEAGSNIMAAIISRPAIRTTGFPLIAPGPFGCLINRYLPFDLARAFGQVPVKSISIFLNRMPLRRINTWNRLAGAGATRRSRSSAIFEPAFDPPPEPCS